MSGQRDLRDDIIRMNGGKHDEKNRREETASHTPPRFRSLTTRYKDPVEQPTRQPYRPERSVDTYYGSGSRYSDPRRSQESKRSVLNSFHEYSPYRRPDDYSPVERYRQNDRTRYTEDEIRQDGFHESRWGFQEPKYSAYQPTPRITRLVPGYDIVAFDSCSLLRRPNILLEVAHLKVRCYVPEEVRREIDHLKDKSKDEDLKAQARRCNNNIQDISRDNMLCVVPKGTYQSFECPGDFRIIDQIRGYAYDHPRARMTVVTDDRCLFVSAYMESWQCLELGELLELL